MADTILYRAGSPEANALDASGFADPSQQTVTANGVTYGPVVSPAASTLAQLGGGGQDGLTTDWLKRLRPASWRGVPFVAIGSDIEGGRRVALHQYPFRDKPYPEDLGRKGETLPMVGFLIGGDVVAKRNSLIQALRIKGPGELAHPTLGRITVQLVNFSIREHRDHGAVFELDMTFVEAGETTYPTTASDSQAATRMAAATAQTAVSGDFLSSIGTALSSGYAAAKAAIAPVTQFANQAMGVVNSATSAYRLATGLVSQVKSFGRFVGSGNPLQAFAAASGSLNGMVAQASTLRAAASSAAGNVESLAGKLGL